MAVTLAQARTRLKSLIGDLGAAQGIDDTTANVLLREAYAEWCEKTTSTVSEFPSIDGITIGGSSTAISIKNISRMITLSRGTSVAKTPLERVEPSEISQMLTESTTAGTLRYYGILPGESELATIQTYPVASASTSLSAMFFPSNSDFQNALIADTSTFHLPNAEAYLVIRVAAIRAAKLLNRPPLFIESLKRGLPMPDQMPHHRGPY